MADIGVAYTLSTPAGDIEFNDGSDDQFYINEIQGLGGRPRRTPADPVPWGPGGLPYPFWASARQITVDGVFLILSEPWGDPLIEIRNTMEDSLRDALDSMGDEDITNTGTLEWTPQGGSSRSLTVRNNVPVEFGHDQNYLLLTFSFGLIADNPDWA